MIIEDDVINEWTIFSAKQFEEVFRPNDKWDGVECDEDYIMRHLKKDKRQFKVRFVTSSNCYNEYWDIKMIKPKTLNIDRLKEWVEGQFYSDIEEKEPCEDYEYYTEQQIEESIKVMLESLIRLLNENGIEIE